MSLPQDAAKMARNGEIETPKLATYAFTNDKYFKINVVPILSLTNIK